MVHCSPYDQVVVRALNRESRFCRATFGRDQLAYLESQDLWGVIKGLSFGGRLASDIRSRLS